jgi:hypothetical protein
MRIRQILIGVAMMALMLTILPGCGGKVSKSNFDKVQNGMTMAEVEGILGKGTEQAGVAGAIGDLAGSGKVMTWTDGEKSITVTFVDGKVTAKASKGL